MLDTEQIAAERQELRYFVDMRYDRQGYEVPIDIDAEELQADLVPLLVQRFHAAHDRVYGFMLDGMVEIVDLRVVGIGRVTKIELPEAEPGAPDAGAARSGETQVYRNGEWLPAPLYDRSRLGRAWPSRARRSSPSWTAPPWCCPATRPRWTGTITC